MTGLDGRVALITGAKGALGSAAVRVFEEAGAVVCRPDPSGPVAGKEWFDVTDTAAASRAVAELTAAYGRIDILLNIVGGWSPQPPVSEMDDDTVDRFMRLNFRSALVMSRSVLPGMVGNRWGRIINVGAKQALKSTANNAAYGASKAAVVALTQSIAEEAGPHGVTCNAIVPSTIDTPRNRADMPRADFSKWVKAEHIAEVMAFLCTEAGGNINGVAIPVWNRA